MPRLRHRHHLVVALLAVAALVAAACDPVQTNATGDNPNNAKAAYLAAFAPAVGAVQSGAPAQAPSGLNPLTCTAGAVDLGFEANTLSVVNYFRQHAGLPAVTLDPTLSQIAQEAAMVHLRRQVSSVGGNPHDPFGANNPCVSSATDPGQIGAANSNLSWGATTASSTPGRANGPRGTVGQMRDNGSNNTLVGHRRAITSPTLTQVGSGSAAWFDTSGGVYNGWYQTTNALYWIADNWPSATRDPDTSYVAWPPAGWTPDEVVYPRWSFAPNADARDVDFSGSTITMETLSGASVPITNTYVRDYTGNGLTIPDDVLVWEPDLPAVSPAVWDGTDHLEVTGDDVVFKVFVNNVVVDGVATDHEYWTSIMDADLF
jgi:uncharacterized protein YkwD